MTVDNNFVSVPWFACADDEASRLTHTEERIMQVSFNSTHKYAKFGRGSIVMEANNGQPLSLDVIARDCPAVMAEDKHFSRSEKYTYISTLQVLKGLEREGFFPHSIMQGGSKFLDRRGFTKHLIRFRQDAAVGRGGTHYEICLLGSHDGTTSYQMFGGFFRALCKNGSIWFDGQATKVVILHRGNVINDVIEGAFTVIGQSQLAYDSVDNLRRIELNRDEQMAYAASAAIARFDADSPVTPAQLLAPRREGDRANDLWTTFNRVQENVIRGGLSYTRTEERKDGTSQIVHRATRPVRSVDGDVRLNRALWTLADEMAKIKAAA
jgi:Domain of unknown function (DUF932)